MEILSPSLRRTLLLVILYRMPTQVIDQTRGRVFSPISKHREVGWKNEAQPSFFNQLRGVWK